MDYCTLDNLAECARPRMESQIRAYSAAPAAAELTERGRARLAALTANGRKPDEFELLELNLKGRPRVAGDRRSEEAFDGTLSLDDINVLAFIAGVHRDKFIRDMIVGGTMGHITGNPLARSLTAAEWRAAGQRPPAPSPAATGVQTRRQNG